MIPNGKAPASKAGARPSLETLGRFGSFTPAVPADLSHGEVIQYANSAWCVIKTSTAYKGSYITLRELVTNDVRTVRIEPHLKIYRVEFPGHLVAEFGGKWGDWKLATGDVVLYPGVRPTRHVLAVRHSNGWFRTSPPWTPFADVEIVHDVVEERALIVHSNIRRVAVDPAEDFILGSVVCSRDTQVPEPSVWFRQAEGYWVGNSRQAPLSDEMVRYELDRGTYRVLRLPEVS